MLYYNWQPGSKPELATLLVANALCVVLGMGAMLFGLQVTVWLVGMVAAGIVGVRSTRRALAEEAGLSVKNTAVVLVASLVTFVCTFCQFAL